jgi:phasin family protein
MPTQQDDFLNLYRAGLAEMLAMTRATLDEFEQLRSRQLEAIREALAENAELTGEIAGAQDMQRLLAIQARFANHQMEVALGYWGRLCEAASHTQLDAMRRLEAQATKFNQRAASMLDTAPPGSEPMVAAMRAFLEAAQTACGLGAQATEQAAKAAETQFETATAGIRSALADASKRSAA